jgi:hypothetical protein
MNSRRLTGSPLRVGRRQTTTPSRARMPLCANREKGWPLLDPYGALVHEHGAVRHNQDSALTSSQARGSFRFPRPSNARIRFAGRSWCRQPQDRLRPTRFMTGAPCVGASSGRLLSSGIAGSRAHPSPVDQSPVGATVNFRIRVQQFYRPHRAFDREVRFAVPLASSRFPPWNAF